MKKKIKTLNEIQHLVSCGYGRPWPRHSLQLLHWFCHDYVTVDDHGDLMALEDPEGGNYGFHSFENRPEDDKKPLLPDQTRPYYEVGNLHAQGAEDLPWNLTRNYDQESTGDDNLSNMDRIIISLSPDLIVDKIYVTQHKDKSSFDRQKTFRISKGLVKAICNLSLDELLSQVGYNIPKPTAEITPSVVQENPADSNNSFSKSDLVKITMPSAPPGPSGDSGDDVSIPIPEKIDLGRPQPKKSWCIFL